MFEFKKMPNGFKYIEVSNDSARAKIAVQGAHLFHYERVGEEPILWLSESSDLEDGKHIRGGIPICWPSFGLNNPELPQHGFARNRMWDLVNIIEDSSDSTQVIMELNDTKKSRREWDYKFNLQIKITISKTLKVELITNNRDSKPFKFTQALHTYFNISDISNVYVEGLDNKPYLDAVVNEKHIQKGDVAFNSEVDYVYQEVDKDILLKDKNREIKIESEGSSSVVVWNPWIEKAKRMSGMKDETYREFVCIETANAFDDYKILQSGEAHTLKATLRVND